MDGVKGKTIEKVNCNLCGEKDYSFLLEGRDRQHGFDGTFSYVRCNNCGLVYQNPQLTLDELKRFYPADYDPFRAGGRTKNKVLKGLITEAPLDPGFFDLITAVQYIEHVINPLDALRKFHYLLKPDGICVISTPSFDSFNAKIFRSKWFPLECPRHLCIYTPETVTLLLRKAGLSPVSIRFDGSSKNMLKSLQYYFYDNNYSPEHRDRVKKSSVIKALVSPLTHIFAMLGRSDNMIVFAKKLSQDRQ